MCVSNTTIFTICCLFLSNPWSDEAVMRNLKTGLGGIGVDFQGSPSIRNVRTSWNAETRRKRHWGKRLTSSTCVRVCDLQIPNYSRELHLPKFSHLLNIMFIYVLIFTMFSSLKLCRKYSLMTWSNNRQKFRKSKSIRHWGDEKEAISNLLVG